VTERVGVIARVRQLAVGVAKAWVEQQEIAGSSLAVAREQQIPAAAQTSS